MRPSVLISLAIAVALLAAGCGGGSGAKSSDGTGASSGTTAGTSGEGAGKGETAAKGKEGEEEGPVVNEEATGGGAGGEGQEGEAKASSGKAALVKSGDAICSKVPERYFRKLRALEKKSGKKKLTTEETNLKAAVPPLYLAAEELEELTAPSGEEEDLEAMVAALEAAAKGLEAKPESALSGPKSPFAEFQKLTQEYGFKVCSQL